ncbi:MAG: (d)CMP kinase [Clostridia bacterium]|nr:(d)CMP kinase [Clostridia bacterium]MBQ1375412.1 (d)CMP kinase [Clostridia bacterium]MBQ1435913.1 (d)CMP kinase [Clostridia bacterium]MBQ4249892.1 (d)CMP kinase [Clostridia bacterium]
MSKINIAIDGPAGAGKSTIAKAVAERRGFLYLDTGALYRTIALYVLRKAADPKDRVKVEALLSEIKIDLEYIDGVQHVKLNGEDVSELIRTPEVSVCASEVSALAGVRAFLLDLQRSIAAEHDCVLDGRDIGTVVLPNAQKKIYLTASPEARAMRRYNEMIAKGEAVEYNDVLRDVLYRDQNDSTRANAPLKSAPDAVIVDSTKLTLEETIDAIDKLIG